MTRGLMVLMVLWSAGSMAEEPPCRATENGTVTCDRTAFDALTRKIVDARAERDVLKVKLDAAAQDRSDVQRALDACASKPPPEPVVIKPTVLSSIGPVVLGAIGAGVLGISSMMDGASTGRVTLAVVGFVSVGAGLYWAMP